MKPSLAFAFAFLASVCSNPDEVLLPINSVQDGKLRQRLEKFILDEGPKETDTAVGDEQGFEKSPGTEEEKGNKVQQGKKNTSGSSSSKAANNPEVSKDDMNYERFIEDELF